jgi:beta-glucosidase
MTRSHFVLITCGVGILAFFQSTFSNPPRLGKDPVKSVLAAMTLEEKAYFVTGTGMNMTGPGKQKAEERPPGAPEVGQSQTLVPGAAGSTYAIPRLGIPPMVVADGPAGLRISPMRENDKATYYCTAFPVSTLMASSWDPDLAFEVGQSMGNEVLEYGVDVLLGPAMNIHRNPLCGRNFEYFSEDPLITGKMAASIVKGVESQGVGTSIKHFVANNTETNRNALDTIVSEKALREVYLEGFRIAVEEAHPWTVMSSYNLINGTYASHNKDLLTKVLRNDWSFKGFVMTDWFGGNDPVTQMTAGNDLLMPGTIQQANAVLRALKEKWLDEAVVDRNIERILKVILQTPRFKGYKPSNKPDLKAHAVVARKAAADGMVLLKNTGNTLPLRTGKKVAVFGNTSYDIITGGTGSGHVNEAYSISLVDGLKGAGYSIHGDLKNRYTDYLEDVKSKRPQARQFMREAPVEEMSVGNDLRAKAATDADAALITIGRNSGEFFDRKVDGDFNLTRKEADLIQSVSEAFHAKGKQVIVVLNVGGVIETASWSRLPDAILLAWQGGQEAGNSIADILSGRVNPSGRLASTFPVRYEDVPSSKNFPGTVLDASQKKSSDADDGMSAFSNPRASRITYEEGVYVGYRYYETFGVRPAYEFGYGLSYTSFSYGTVSMSGSKFSGEITATVSIKNMGKRAGKEVVQLYIAAPFNKIDKPVLELKAFTKTRLLQPGETQAVRFLIEPRQLSSFDPETSNWVAEAGTYTVKIGSSSRDIRQTGIFTVDKDLVVKKESAALVPGVSFNELRRGKP